MISPDRLRDRGYLMFVRDEHVDIVMFDLGLLHVHF